MAEAVTWSKYETTTETSNTGNSTNGDSGEVVWISGTGWGNAETFAENSIQIDSVTITHTAITASAGGAFGPTKCTLGAYTTEKLADVIVTGSVTTSTFSRSFMITLYCRGWDVREQLNIEAGSYGKASDEQVYDSILEAEREVDQCFMGDQRYRTKRIFATFTQTETDETLDVRLNYFTANALYPFINDISSLSYYVGGTSYTSKTESIDGDWYASAYDKEFGRIRLRRRPRWEPDSIKLTYTHYAPSRRHDVQKLTKLIASRELLYSVVRSGERDPFQQKYEILDKKIEALKAQIGRSVPWLVL